jgi:hypothetical protein
MPMVVAPGTVYEILHTSPVARDTLIFFVIVLVKEKVEIELPFL